MTVRFTILNAPHSKSNSSQIITLQDGNGGSRSSLIKSKKARTWVQDALPQIPAACRVRMQGPVIFYARIFYPSNIQDLDESLVLDVLQDQWKTIKHADGSKQRQLVQAGVYLNDRQVREKHIYHGIDKVNPRVEIQVESMDPQRALLAPEPPTVTITKAKSPPKPKRGETYREPRSPLAVPAPRPADMAKAVVPAPASEHTVFKMFDSLAAQVAARKAKP